MQSYINNPTPSSLLPLNVVFATLIRFKRTPSLSIGLRPLRQSTSNPLKPLPNLNETSSQGVHFYEPIIKLNPEGANNVLTFMVGSNIGESKDYVFVFVEDGVTTRSNALLEKNT